MNRRALNGSTKVKNELALRFSFKVSWGGVRLSPLGTSSTVWPIVPAPDDRWWWLWSNRRNEDWQGKPKYSEKTCRSVHHESHMTWPGIEPGPPRGESRRRTSWAMVQPWRCGYSLDLYSGGVWFESRPGRRLSWLKIFVAALFHPNKCLKSTSIRSLSIDSKSFPIIFHLSSCLSTVW
jgi:hypothetical protein